MGSLRMLATLVALALPALPALAGESAATIEGPTWLLSGLPGHDLGPLNGAGRPVTARFEGGRLSGFSGCNRFVGGYSVDRDQVSVNVGSLAGTMMACPADAMTIEGAFKGALTGPLRYTITGDRLVLTPSSGAPLVFVREVAVLEGAKWEITGFNNGRQAVVSPLIGTQLTLSFANGTLSGSSGCNTFHAAYQAEGGRIAIQAPATTRKLCAGKGVMEQERQFLTALETATVWAISGGMLDVHRADGERVLTANRRAR